MKKIIIDRKQLNRIKHGYSFSSLSLTTITIIFVGLLSNTYISEASAQQQNSTNSTNIRTFQLTFDSLIINDDHDPLFPGEWVMDAYVNNRLIDLFPGSISVNNGETINFTTDNSANLTVPDDNTGFIRIATVGWENDIGYESIPIFFALLDTRVPFYIYENLVQESTVPFIIGSNDPNGFVAVQYDKNSNFGVGPHSICSERNAAATNLSPFEGDCDYRINFTIEEIHQ